jgi:hypothetical protein
LSLDELQGPSSSTRIWVDDVNSDGKLDILVGDNTTLVSLPEGISEEEFQERSAAWNKAIAEASEEMTTLMAELQSNANAEPDGNSDTDEAGESDESQAEDREKAQAEAAEKLAAAQERFSELYQSRSEFVLEERTGFVWLYLGK